VTNDRTADELEIRNLIAALAVKADIGEIDEYAALFTDDAVWEMPANPAMGLEASVKNGRGDIVEGVRTRRSSGVQGPGSGTMHSITTQLVEVSGDDASGHVYYQFLGSADGKPAVLTLGRYEDRYRRTPGGWKVAHRKILLG
jgi:3-phenylpropionate/cinnamic acid dioxygenase small subunit